jgi:hypothetical protein
MKTEMKQLIAIPIFVMLLLASCERHDHSDAQEDTNPRDNTHPQTDVNPKAEGNLETPDEAGSTEATNGPEGENTIEFPAAQWMSGKWGIGWRFHGGNNNWSKQLDVNYLVEQVKTIPNVSYVLFNLSRGADGSVYSAPHSVLNKVNPGCCSQRDLFGEAASAFQAAGYKVLVYMATQGPAQLKHGPHNETDAKRVANWKAWVKTNYGSDDTPTLKKAYAEVIVREFAQRYGTQIDGWWFDHSSFGNIKLIHKEVTKANPKAVVAFCSGLGTIENKNPDYEDYTAGHPIPMRREQASTPQNLRMIESIEKSQNGFLIKEGKASLGHVFMPMKDKWNKGKNIVWTEAQAVEWMQRVLQAGGAWTWNVPCHDGSSKLNPACVEFMKRVGAKLR